MPSSQYYQINEIVELIFRLKPGSILEIGPGFGKYGFLCREYVELWDGRNAYGDWRCRIDCIEAYEKYITPAHRFIYNQIYIGNALELVPKLDQHYDLVLMVDVLEHFTFEEGNKLLEECKSKTDHMLIASPRFVNMQEGVFENPFERHRSEWKKKHLKVFGPVFFAPHHSTLICLLGAQAEAIGKEYLRSSRYLFLKKHFRFLRFLKPLFN